MNDSIQTLKDARQKLLKLHLELISSERNIYEKSAGEIPSPGAFLQLLAHDPWFEWLRPFSKLIAKTDDALADKKHPITGEAADTLLGEIRDLVTTPSDDHGFGETYHQSQLRDPHVLAAHSALVRALGTP